MAIDPGVRAQAAAAAAAYSPAEVDLSSSSFNASRYLAVTHANTSFPELLQSLEELRKTTSDKTAQLKALVSAHFDQYLSCHEAVRTLAADVSAHTRESETLVADMQNLQRVADASLAVMLQRAREQRRIRHSLAVLARLRPILELTSKMKSSLRIQDYDTLAVDYARLKHQSGKITNLAPPLKKVVAAGHEIAATANSELLRRLEDMSVSVADQKHSIDVLTALGLIEKPILTCLTKQFEFLERKLAEISDQGSTNATSEELMKECVVVVSRFRGGLWGFICELFRTPAGNVAATANAITSVEAERVQQQAWNILSTCVKLLEHHATPPSASRLKLLTEAFRQLRCLKKCPNAATLNSNIDQLNETFCGKFRTTITLAYLEQICRLERSGLIAEYFEPVVTVIPSFSSEISLADTAASTSNSVAKSDTQIKIHRVIMEARQAFDVIRNASTVSSESKILLHRPSVFTNFAMDVLQRWKTVWKNVGQVLLDVLDMKDSYSNQTSAQTMDDDVDFHFRTRIVQALEEQLNDMLSEFLDKTVAAFVAEISLPAPAEASAGEAGTTSDHRGGARVCILLAIVANCVELREKCLRIVDGWITQLKQGDIAQDGYSNEHGRAATSGTRGLYNFVQNVEMKCMDIYSSTHAKPLQRILRAGAAEEPFQSHSSSSSSRYGSRTNRSGSIGFPVPATLQTTASNPSSSSTPTDPRQYVFNVLLQLITLRSEVEMSVGGYPQCWDYVRSVTDPLTAALAEFLERSVNGLDGASSPSSSLDEWKRSHLLVEARFFQSALSDLMAEGTKSQLEAVEKQLAQSEPANPGHLALLNQMKHQTKLYLLALQQ